MNKLEINVGQVFLTHPHDENFTSVYEEAFSKQGAPIHLFAVIEIGRGNTAHTENRREEYEKLSRAIVGTLKRSFIGASAVDDDTFEKALAAVNAALARLATKEQVAILPRLNVVIGAVFGNMLTLSAAGSGLVYLKRQNELTCLSEGLAVSKLLPTKFFSNFSGGKLAASDRVLLANREVLNFLSIERLKEFLSADTLEEACSEIIEPLTDINDTGFGAYVFEVTSGEKTSITKKSALWPAMLQLPKKSKYASGFQSIMAIASQMAVSAASFIWQALSSLAALAVRRNGRVRSKKYLITAVAFVFLIFLGNLGYAAWKKGNQVSSATQTEIETSLDQKISEAEGALIYNNHNRSLVLVPEIENLLGQLDEDAEKRADFEKRFQELKNKVNKEQRIDNPTVLTTFETVPTDLIRSPNGFLGFNKNTGRLVFYDFRSGAAQSLLQNQNTGSLSFGLYLGPAYGYVFLDKDGKWQKLDQDSQALTVFASAAAESPAPGDLGRAKAATVLGIDTNARLYVLDGKNQQIWRLNVDTNSIGAPQAWLKTSADFTDSLDLAVDGSIYILYSDGLVKYANGSKQSFAMPPVQPPMQNLTGVFATADTAGIYLLDPEHERVVVLNKDGSLAKQIITPKFRDLQDIYVDETAGLLYALSGSELLQINLK